MIETNKYSLLKDLREFLENPRSPLSKYKELRIKEIYYGTLKEILLDQDYYWLWSRLIPNTTFLDLGAFVGDTASYFGMNPNVKKIMAFEPSHPEYLELVNTVDRIPFGKKIQTIFAGVSDKDGEVVFGDMAHGASMNIEQMKSRKGIKTPLMSFSKIISKCDPPIALKCDIEGTEHKIFNKSIDLEKVYAMQIEYNYGIGHIIDVLQSKGFKTSSKLINAKNSSQGYIYAERYNYNL